METMTRDGAVTTRREAAGMGRPLLLSAAAHLLALSAALQLGVVSAAVPWQGVVQVLLVGDPEGGPGRSRAASGIAAADTDSHASAGAATAAFRPARFVEAPAPTESRATSPALPPGGPGPHAGESSHRAAVTASPESSKETAAAVNGPEIEGSAARHGSHALSGIAASHPAGPGAETSAREGRPAPPEMVGGSGVPGGTAGSASVGAPREYRPRGAPSEAVAGPPGPGAGTGAGTARGDASRLRERIQSRIVYPEEAVRRGQEGEVLLRIRVGSGGHPGEIVVARSSGARLLDDAARRGVARAAPLPSGPGWVEVPVQFRLR